MTRRVRKTYPRHIHGSPYIHTMARCVLLLVLLFYASPAFCSLRRTRRYYTLPYTITSHHILYYPSHPTSHSLCWVLHLPCALNFCAMRLAFAPCSLRAQDSQVWRAHHIILSHHIFTHPTSHSLLSASSLAQASRLALWVPSMTHSSHWGTRWWWCRCFKLNQKVLWIMLSKSAHFSS